MSRVNTRGQCDLTNQVLLYGQNRSPLKVPAIPLATVSTAMIEGIINIHLNITKYSFYLNYGDADLLKKKMQKKSNNKNWSLNNTLYWLTYRAGRYMCIVCSHV